MMDDVSHDESLAPDDDYRRLMRWFQADIKHVEQWRKCAKEDYDFYNGKQWSDEDSTSLRLQKRPTMTFNRIAPLVNAVVGAERNNRREVQFIPRQEGAALANELLTGAAEWFRQEALAEYADSDAFQDTVICGMGWTDTRLDYENNPDGDPVVARLDPMKMVWPSTCVKPNLADATRLFYVDKKTIEEARALFPHAADADLDANINALDDSVDFTNIDSSTPKEVTILECRWFEREPYYKVTDPQSRQIRDISEQEFRQLKQHMPQIHGVRLTRKTVKRAFLGKKLLAPIDQPMTPHGQLGWECITGYFDKVNKRYYGIVAPTKDPQRWANKYFSQVMYLLNSQSKGGIMAERGAFDDDSLAAASLARSDMITWTSSGALTGGRIQPKPAAQFPAGFFRLFEEAKEAITQVTGLSPEFIGTREVNQAGVLEAQRRQSSLNLLAGLFDALRLYRQRQGKLILHLIQNYMADGRLVKIAGQDKAQYVPLMKRDVTSVEYDIIVDDAPTSPNEKERTFALIMQLMPLIQEQLTPDLLFELLRYSPLPASLLDRVQGKVREQMQSQEQQKARALQEGDPREREQQLKLQAVGAKAQAEMQKAAADQQIAQTKVSLEQIKAAQKMQDIQAKMALSNQEIALKAQQMEERHYANDLMAEHWRALNDSV